MNNTSTSEGIIGTLVV